jgi:hypothetical protein
MPDRVATVMIVQSLQEILNEIRAMRAELNQLNQSSRAGPDDRQPRRDSPAPLARFPASRRTTSSS